MFSDIRDKPRLNHADILQLNFIRSPGHFYFRRHHRAGLRSHIMAVLDPEGVKREKEGIERDGAIWFPKAKPLKMLRIFRTRFDRLEDAQHELNRVKMVERYLAPEYVARSTEFLVDYAVHGKYETLLCGLQEYVEGEILDPWGSLNKHSLWALFCRMANRDLAPTDVRIRENEGQIDWAENVRKKAMKALTQIRKMVAEACFIPDLAGVGNLVLTRSGGIKLVDINNISKVSCGSVVSCDDKGYPVCDKSVEALSLLEQKILGHSLNEMDPIYGAFLDSGRLREVRELEKVFHRTMGPAGSSYPAS